MGRVVKGFGYVVLCIGFAAVVLNLAGIYLGQGWSGLQDALSPRNTMQYMTHAIMVLPGILLVALGEKIAAKRRIHRRHGKL